jgi:exopolyphosphatase / guanosine-5'-triphosphate,3'-diphosphate pyrophosphatase
LLDGYRAVADTSAMPELVALIDLGSNAARFLLTRINEGVGFRILKEQRIQTRLGSGAPGRLPQDAVDSTLHAVHRFLGAVNNGVRPRVVAVATAAVRDAANRERLLGPLRRHDGVDVRILTARQEARLGALAALSAHRIRQGAVADLGGGSLQVSRVRAGRPVAFASLPLGAVRLTRRFFHHDPPTGRELRALRNEIRAHVLSALPPAAPGDELIGLGGTVRALARMHLARTSIRRRSRHGLRLQQSDVIAIRQRLETVSLRRRRHLRGLKAERADIILAGAVVIEELMVFGGYRTITVSTLGVRDGILLRETFNGHRTP